MIGNSQEEDGDFPGRVAGTPRLGFKRGDLNDFFRVLGVRLVA